MRAREGEKEKNESFVVLHVIVSFQQIAGKRRVGEKKVSETGFFWTSICFLIVAEVSAPATGPNQDLNIHSGPGQADGSGIQLFK